jgi:uncharacterized integral membrane protein
MQAVRTIIWVLIAVFLTVFAVANSQTAEVRVWPGIVAELPLSVLIIVVFLLGFLPPFLIGIGSNWRLNRQIRQHEHTIATLRTPAPAPAPTVADTLASTVQPPLP